MSWYLVYILKASPHFSQNWSEQFRKGFKSVHASSISLQRHTAPFYAMSSRTFLSAVIAWMACIAQKYKEVNSQE